MNPRPVAWETEDIRFSPSNRRLAIAGFSKNKITVFDIFIDLSPDGTRITLTDVAAISSNHLRMPHGIDFVDEETIIVANRTADATILKLPSRELGGNCYELAPLEVIRSGDVLQTPGSVSVTRKDDNLYEALICNNYRHNVTRHFLDFSTGCSINSNEVFSNRSLEIPDGICISNDQHWIAVSNHMTHNVFLYEYNSSLNAFSDPDGILRCVYYPHGLRFTSDGRFILVADAAAPYVHIYAKNGSSWRGVHNPIRSLRVMSDQDFLRGRHNPQEGGPKGIDVDNAMNILAITCGNQPLAFFDLKAIIQKERLYFVHLIRRKNLKVVVMTKEHWK